MALLERGRLTFSVFLVSVSLVMLMGTASAFFQMDPSITENPNEDAYLVIVETLEYLVKFGYLIVDPTKGSGGATPQDFYTAIGKLQRFMELPATGSLDMETLKVVRTPRCGMKDPVDELTALNSDNVNGSTSVNSVYTSYGQKWNKTDLTYRIFKFPKGVKKSKYRNAVQQACEIWSDVTPLTLREVSRKTPADIDIRFYSRYHGDNDPFDGPHGVVGHPVLVDVPGGGHVVRLDIDADEAFSFNDQEGLNLYQVLVHELGHALGLGHTSDHESIMSPCTKPYMADFRLSDSDVRGIQALYGAPQAPTEALPPTRPLPPSSMVQHSEPRIQYLCEERPLDAIAVLNGQIYVFKGNRYWQFREPNDMVSPREGSFLGDRWPGVPSGVDAVYQRDTDNKVVFVRVGRMWIYDVHPKIGESSSPVYTQVQLRDKNLPRGINVAIPSGDWPRSTYFIKGGKVWHFSDETQTVIAGPLQIQDLFSGVPRKVDAAFKYNGISYFVRDKDYWKVDQVRGQVEDGFPQNFHTSFLGC